MNSIFDIAQSLDPDAAEPYLRAHGWELAHQGELGNRWRLRTDATVRNVAVPLPLLDDDDRGRMFVSVLMTLAEIEQRDPKLIARDLREAASDLVEFRIVAEPLENGEIPLKAAPELTGGAYAALQAAARSEFARRPHYAQGNLPAGVRRFVEAAKLVGTDKGSVILRVRPPAPDEPRQATIEGVDAPAPFERRVAQRLVEGVRAAKTAAHRDPAQVDLDGLDGDIEEGLSANLCDALVDLSGKRSGLDARVAVRVRWALTRPADEPATVVELDRGEIGRLPAVAAILKQIDPLPNSTVTGYVTRFHRELGGDVGEVWLNADLDGELRRVRVELERSDYELAMQAHSAEREVRVVGTLERAGHAREVTDPTSFSMAE